MSAEYFFLAVQDNSAELRMMSNDIADDSFAVSRSSHSIAPHWL